MYIRTISRKNKDGSKVTYVQLAHNERVSSKGHPKAKILFNFGRIENLDVEQLKRLVKSISRFLPPEEALATQAQLKHRGKVLQWSCCRSFGGPMAKAQFPKAIGKVVDFQRIRHPYCPSHFCYGC